MTLTHTCVLTLAIFLLPPSHCRCIPQCTPRNTQCSIERIPKRVCHMIEQTSAEVERAGNTSILSDRRHTQVTWQIGQGREFSGLLSLRDGSRCFNISIGVAEGSFAEGAITSVQCRGRGGTVRLYRWEGKSAVKMGEKSSKGRGPRYRGLRPSIGDEKCRCRTPYRVMVIPSLDGVIGVIWEEYGGTRNLSISIVNTETGMVAVTTNVDISSTANHGHGKVGLGGMTPTPGRYMAVVRPIGCPNCKRESAVFDWPFSAVTTNPSVLPESRKPCTCWTPAIVKVVVNTTSDNVTIEWTGHYEKSDLKIGIVKEDETDAFVAHTTVHPVQVHMDMNCGPSHSSLLMRQERDATILSMHQQSSHRYIALVGSIGCTSCTRYRESEPFYWPPETSLAPSSELPEVSTNESKSEGPKRAFTAVEIVIGVLAFIAVFALGIILINRCCSTKCAGLLRQKESPYRQISRDSTMMTILEPRGLDSVRSVLVLYPANNESLQNAAHRLQQRLLGQEKQVTCRELDDDVIEAQNDIIMYVTSRTSCKIPDQLKNLGHKTVTVGVAIVKWMAEPTVAVPTNFIYSDMPNNLSSLEDFLELLGGYTSPRTAIDEKVNIFLICSGEDDRRIAACWKFVKLVEHPPFHVVFADDCEQRVDLRQNKEEWIRRQLNEAHFIIVIPSADLDSVEAPSNLTMITNIALDIAEQSASLHKKIVLVSLGDCTNDSITTKRPNLSTCPEFFLVQDPCTDCPTVDLRPLLEHMCTEFDIVEQLCCQGDVQRICDQDDSEFLRAVQKLNLGFGEHWV